MCLKSQFFRRVLDLCNGIPDDVIAFDRGVDHITAAMYKRDALSVASDVYHDFNSHLNVRRIQNE